MRYHRNVIRFALPALVMGVLLSVSGCKQGCLGGEADCRIPTPCQKLTYTCDDPQLELQILRQGDAVPGGTDAC